MFGLFHSMIDSVGMVLDLMTYKLLVCFVPCGVFLL
jgi:hypothetical protein